MKKHFYLCVAMVITIGSLNAQNNLLSGAITGNPFSNGGYASDIEFVYDSTDLILVIGNDVNSELYALDFNHTTSAGVLDWTIDDVPDVMSSIAATLGANVTDLAVWDMEVNPKTKAVCMLIYNSNASYIVIVEVKGPTSISSTLGITSSTYSTVTLSANGNTINDLEWGSDGQLYFCTGDFTLDGEVGSIAPPFVHNSTALVRVTSVFKSNWGGGYFTNAPLEKISFSTVDGTDRLMGVTTCAPGFSIEASKVNGATGVLQVTEDFDVRSNSPIKVVSVTQEDSVGNTTSYLFDLHNKSLGSQLIRIGEMYLNGDAVINNQYNANAQKIRDISGDITSGLTEEQAKIITTGFKMIAKYSEYELMVIDDNDVLKLYEIGEPPPQPTVGIDKLVHEGLTIHIYPNPVDNILNIQSGRDLDKNIYYKIYSVNGELADQSLLKNHQINLEHYNKGIYILTLYQKDKLFHSEKIILD